MLDFIMKNKSTSSPPERWPFLCTRCGGAGVRECGEGGGRWGGCGAKSKNLIGIFLHSSWLVMGAFFRENSGQNILTVIG